ncbi:MAG: tyrosine-type recombinase/integrase [Alphaproteobacteria bacterium]
MTKKFSKLTRPNIRNTCAGETLIENGISFRREANGDGVYSVNIMVDGERIHRTIGRESEGTTRQQAEDFIARARTDSRRDRLGLPEGRKTPLMFKEGSKRYIARLREEDGKNIDAKERQLKQHLIPFFGGKPLAQISSFDIERYKKKRTGADVAKATVNRELAVLSHLVNKALEWGWIKSKAIKLNRFKEDNARIIYLTAEQCAALLEAATEDQNENVHAFVMIGLHTGMRLQEILSLNKNNVDLERLVIWIPKAKAGKREQPITEELAEYLKARISMLPEGCEWILPSPGSKTGYVNTIRKAFRRVVEKAGLDPDTITPHIMRHTTITLLIQAGVDLPTVQRISGHKTPAMVMRYAHQNGAHIQAAMSKLQFPVPANTETKKASNVVSFSA